MLQQNAFLRDGILCYTEWLETNCFGLVLNFLKWSLYFLS